MAIGTLTIDVEAKLARLEQGLQGAIAANQRAANSVDRAWASAGAALRGTFAGVVAGLGVGAFSNFARTLVDGVDKLNDLADATGSSVENISALEDVARRTGASIDTVGDILVRFNKVLADAKPGTDAAAALDALGLSARQLRAEDPSEALRRTAVALAGFADDGNKARIVQELFGKSVREAAPFLNDLARAGQLNATVTSEQAREAERFNQQIASLSRNFETLSRTVLGGVLPTLNQYLQLIGKLASGPGLGASLGEVFKGNSFTSVQSAFDSYKKQLDEIDQKIARIGSGQDRRFNIYGRDFLADLQASRKGVSQFLEVYRDLLNANSGGGGRGSVVPGAQASLPSLPSSLGGGKPGEAAKAARAFDDYATSITESIARLAEDTQTVKLAKLNDQLRALDNLVRSGFDPTIAREIRQALEGPITVAQPAVDVERIERARKLMERTPGAARNEVIKDAEALAFAQARGAFTAEEYGEALKVLADRFTELDGPVKESTEKMSEFAQQAQRNIQDSLGDTLRNVLDGNFKDIGRLWGNLLKDMIAQALAVDLNNALFRGSKAGGLSDLVAGFQAVLGLSHGGAFGPGGVQFFSGGGVFSRATAFAHAGGLGVLGEAGPEAVMPLSRGPDGKLGVRAQGGGQTLVQHNTINVGQFVTPGEMRMVVAEMGRLAVSKAKGEIRQSMSRGGVFAQ